MNQPKPQRDTLNNFIKLLKSGQILEILKVLRRRLINGLRFIIRITLRSLGIYYDSPWVRKRLLKKLLERYYDWSQQDQAKLKVALVLRDGTTYPYSSAFIRLFSPLTSKPLKNKLYITLHPQNTVDVGNADICIVQRTAYDHLPRAQQLVENIRQQRASLIIDTDDAFHLIDPGHPERNLHTGALEAFNYLTKSADQLWVSTSRLKSLFLNTKAPVIVVPNSLDRRIWRTEDSNKQPLDVKPLQMLYMGTVSHDADWDMVFPVLEKLAKLYPSSFELTVIGVSSDRPLRPWINRLHQGHNGSIYPRFVSWYLRQGPFDIGLSPLVDTDFNRNKSDIKCLDYLAAGVLPVVSDVEPYRSKDLDEYIVRVKNTEKAWEEKLTDLIKDRYGLRQRKSKTMLKDREYIWEERSSKNTADQIAKLLKLS